MHSDLDEEINGLYGKVRQLRNVAKEIETEAKVQKDFVSELPFRATAIPSVGHSVRATAIRQPLRASDSRLSLSLSLGRFISSLSRPRERHCPDRALVSDSPPPPGMSQPISDQGDGIFPDLDDS
ncbi:Bet1-like protein [Acorus gramineus]|uniref:Bet1-like protein n=1 Tax=Acorus gramineus TaxID=55184 RepID=A0AAV9BFW5_ACOGR|nr:Bet1-like protein [Acorus gramineus]